MVARGAGAVGCAHCTKIGAEVACQICTRLVCAACAADWATCEEPSGRIVRLGLTARVRDVDPLGRMALVSHWRKPLRIFDLRRLRWIDIELPRRFWLAARQSPPRLSSDGRLFFTHSEHVGDMVRGSTRSLDLRSDRVHILATHPPDGTTGVSPTGDRFYFVDSTQEVAVTSDRDPNTTTRDLVWYVQPLPRKVLHAVYIDGERLLIAAGSWSELALHRIVDGTLERLAHTRTDAHGNVRWVAVAGRWLVAIVVTDARNADVEIRALDEDLSVGELVHRCDCLRSCVAALSRDGRYFACATNEGLRVHELGTDNITVYDEHTDRINYVRFAADDHVLISADTDHRIVMRPRTPTGYARPLVRLEIPEEPVPFPPRDAAPR